MKNNLEEADKYNWRVPRIKKNVTVTTIECSNCGYAVESFSDEEDSKCPKCKNVVTKKACQIVDEHKLYGY